jgi:hypothetical protein
VIIITFYIARRDVENGQQFVLRVDCCLQPSSWAVLCRGMLSETSSDNVTLQHAYDKASLLVAENCLTLCLAAV